MMNWNSIYGMGSDNSGIFWHEFKFENRIPFSGIQIKSGNKAFPSSFDIKINGSLVYSTRNAAELKGANKEMNITFQTVTEGDIVRIEQTGPNWDLTDPDNKNAVKFNKIELYSTDPQYEGGVFKSLMKKYEANDPHKIHVIHSSKNFDHNLFYDFYSNTMVCTIDDNDQYFDIELPEGRMVVNGIRLKNIFGNKYILKGSNDNSYPTKSWVDIKFKERKNISTNTDLRFYEIESIIPYKYFRIMNKKTKGPIEFYHLELFGCYIQLSI